MQPLGRNRWTLFHRDDRLVHRVMPMYRTVYTNHKDRVYPDNAITECGHRVHLLMGTTGECKEGYYTDDERMLTCIQCLSGVAKTGIMTRQEQKNLMFAQMYGQPNPSALLQTGRRSYNYATQSSASHVAMQNIPLRGYKADQVLIDEVKSLKGFAEVEALLAPYASWLAKMPKP